MTPASAAADADLASAIARLPSVFRPQDLRRFGLSPGTAAKWVRAGKAERIGRGLYRVTDYDFSELATIAEVATAIPAGVICLLTALRMHVIGTQSPPDVWIAIGVRARRPQTGNLPVRIVRFSPRMMTCGVEDRVADGVPFRVTSPARTVVDCFRYRNKVGLDVALEALREVLEERRVMVNEIDRIAEALRAREVMRPYMQAILA